MDSLFINKEKTLFILLICGTLLFPLYNFFHLYFIINISILAFLIVIYKYKMIKAVKISLLLSFLYVLGRIFVFFDTDEIFIKDFYELARFSLVIIILSLGNFFRKINLKFILIVLSGYVFLDFIISFLQFSHFDINNLIYRITELYSSPHHFNGSYFGNRSNGLSSGPGQHGQLMAFLYVIFFVAYLLNKDNRTTSLYLVTSFLALFTLFFAQSKTTIIAIIITNITMFIWIIYIRDKDIIKKFLFANGIIVSGLIVLLYFFYYRLTTIFALLEKGFNLPSFQIRLKSYSIVFDKAYEKLEYSFLGFGKVYFGHYSSSMDSDLIYIITVYGLIFASILIYLTSNFFIKSIKIKEKLVSFKVHGILFFVIITGLISSCFAGFFIHPLNLILFSILLIKVYDENITSI